jgi:DNA-binding YbaB/EbfC family protein
MAKGFKGPRMSGGMGGGMMGQLQKLQEQLQQAQASLAEETVTYTAGGGAIKMTMTGDQHCTAVIVDPEMIKDMVGGGDGAADVEMLQDLILAAVNGVLDASRKLAEERLGPLAGGLPF